ncbi:probable serine/threonine-protein kinase DDB_G0270146 isoform X1 [Lepeophtheirus salmonis]|uniref:probable serine/threonine-protein kinase DDB_G0270146 isoform X1 n=1 Tax=Lepeophtheirus salmonis TaxID=72036 RepID=UPI001AE60804|nr:probable serine/threonine-protein kinase DDB_G0270146 [Lepeophtheirus salmonis]
MKLITKYNSNHIRGYESNSLFPQLINRRQILELTSKRFSESLPASTSYSKVSKNKSVRNNEVSQNQLRIIGKSICNGSYQSSSVMDCSNTSFTTTKEPKQTDHYSNLRITYLNSINVHQNLIKYSTSPVIIGHGTYSNVYKGQLFNKEVAVKRFNKSKESSVNKKNLLHEGIMSLQLRHENIIQLLGVICNDKDSLYALIFEYMNLGSLESYILNSHNSISTAFILSITNEVGNALCYMHDRGIVHLDVKSSNILLTNHPCKIRAKLADLGFAQKLVPHNSSKILSIRGTPAWMAPEILVKRKRIYMYPSADIYSFGILLWQLFERKEPYKDLSIGEVYEFKAKNHHPELSSLFTSALKEILLLCWYLDPFSRPSIREILKKMNSCMGSNNEEYNLSLS